jgi:sulfite reductase (ferredoxin)
MISEPVLKQFEHDVAAYLGGSLAEERFTALRLLQGVYAQRQEGYYMVRSKLPGGRLRPGQLAAFADALEEYSREGHDVVHITTRQDIQLHYLRLEDVPRAVRLLARHGVTTREASGNTVRNITGCPLAGVCPREHVDIRTHLDAAARHFLGHPLTQELPRKFKISFAGCEADCAQGLINDLAVAATRRDGAPGFRLLAFGGLGAKPYAAVTLDEFVAEADLLPAIEAVLALHHRHSDRRQRSRSRIKFLLERFGLERLQEMYREEFRRSRAGFDRPAPIGAWRLPEPGPAGEGGSVRRATAQHQPGRLALPVQVPFGRLDAGQLRGLARLLPELGLDELQTTQDQNLLIPHVPTARLAALRQGLAALRLHEPKAGEDVVACPGTHLCPLALVASPALGRALQPTADLRIRINGCQNSCAQSDIGDIGLYGQARRHHGSLVPSYALQLGGDGLAGGGLGLDGPTVPARRAAEAVRRIETAYTAERAPGERFRSWARRKGEGWFAERLADLAEVTEAALPELLRDLGTTTRFQVGKVGPGECAGAKVDPVALAKADLAYQRCSRNAFAVTGDYGEARECLETMLALAAGAAGADGPRADADLTEQLQALREALAGAADADGYAALAPRVDRWVEAALAAANPRRPRAAGTARVPLEAL